MLHESTCSTTSNAKAPRRSPWRLLLTIIAVVALAGCGQVELVDSTGSTLPPFDPALRVVHIETTGCGFAADRTGSGVAIGEGRVITAAHLIAMADTVVAAVGDGSPQDAVVMAVDLKRDLALLQVPADGIPGVRMSSVGVGAEGLIVGGATSGTVPYVVKDVVRLSIEEILGTTVHQRLGYELDAATTTGDSGAGVYDDQDRLIGIVFATSVEGGSTWVTSSVEIDDFLSNKDTSDFSAAAVKCADNP